MGPTHPESPRRLEALIELLDSPQVADLNLLRVGERLADEAEIVRVHTGDYWRRIADSEGHHVQLDPDTRASPRSFEAARRASGAALQAFDAVLRGDARNGFALVRPPGHHAEAYSAMGFCLFNSVAIVAQHARAVHGLERIAIIDFDVHHGNGTQAAFWDDPNTLFISSHQFPFYPGTGAAFEVGGSSAEGATLNFALRPGHGDAHYGALYASVIPRILEQFAPDAILVSAGFDLMAGDPLAGMKVTASGLTTIAQALLGAAERLCDGRITFLLEGGYDLANLQAGVHAVLRAAGNPPRPTNPVAPLRLEALGDAAQSLDAMRAFYSI